MQIETTIRYHYISISMVNIKMTILSADQDIKDLEHSHITGRNVKWYN